MDDYNCEDFDYNPDELDVKSDEEKMKKNQYKEQKLPSQHSQNASQPKISSKASNEKEVNSKLKSTDNYGGFEEGDYGNDEIEEIPQINLDEIRSTNRNANSIAMNNNNNNNNNSLQVNKQPIAGTGVIQPQNQQTNIPTSEIPKDYKPSVAVHQPQRIEKKNEECQEIKNQSLEFTSGNKNSIHVHNPVPLSRFQIAEQNYYQIRSELEKVFNMDYTNMSADLLAKQNEEMIHYLEKMNNILTNILDASKIPMTKQPKKAIVGKNKNQNQNMDTSVTINVNSNKLVDVYKKEYLKLEQRLKQISDPSFEPKLEDALNELNAQISLYEHENKKLKNSQKVSEVLFERQYKNNLYTNTELKRISMDYEKIKRTNEAMMEKVAKNKKTIAENDEKIAELTEWQGKLEQIAKEMYEITEYENIKEEEMNERKAIEKKNTLKKKLSVLEKVLANNKNKYEFEIVKNEKTIVGLEKSKIELLRALKEKSAQAFKNNETVQEVYQGNSIGLDYLTENIDMKTEINNQARKEELEISKDKVKESEREKQQRISPIIHKEDISATESHINNNKSFNKDISKDAIIKELEKKASKDKEVIMEIGNNSNINLNLDIGIGNTSNISIPSTKVPSKPNFAKFSQQNSNLGKLEGVGNKNQATKRKNDDGEILEEITKEIEHEINIEKTKIQSAENADKEKKEIEKEKEKPKSIQEDAIPELKSQNSAHNIIVENSRRINHNISSSENDLKSKENENYTLPKNANSGNINSGNPNVVSNTKQESNNVPSFLQDFQEKKDITLPSNMVNKRGEISPLSRKVGNNTQTEKKVTSLFEDALQEVDQNFGNLNKKESPHYADVEQVRQRKEKFENLFKEEPEIDIGYPSSSMKININKISTNTRNENVAKETKPQTEFDDLENILI